MPAHLPPPATTAIKRVDRETSSFVHDDRRTARPVEAEHVDRSGRRIERVEVSPRVVANLGAVCMQLGDFDAAERHMRDALERRTAVLGPTHRDTLDSASNLATLLLTRGEAEPGAELLAMLVEDARRAYGEDDWHVAVYRLNLAGACVDLGRLDEAEVLLALAISALDAALGADHPHARAARTTLRIAGERRAAR